MIGVSHDAAGQPFINEKPATWDDDQEFLAMFPSLSPWKCPECGAHLAREGHICLNACHLNAASYRRFQAGLKEAQAQVEKEG